MASRGSGEDVSFVSLSSFFVLFRPVNCSCHPRSLNPAENVQVEHLNVYNFERTLLAMLACCDVSAFHLCERQLAKEKTPDEKGEMGCRL